MKRFYLILALVLSLALLAGCGSNRPTANTPILPLPKEETPVTTAPQQTIPVLPESTQPEIPAETAPMPEATTEAVTEPPTTAPTVKPTPAPADDHSAQIEQIRTWYRQIVSDSALNAETFGDAATVYWKDGQIFCVAEYHQLNDAVDPAFAEIRYYYHNDTPFFVFIQYQNTQYDEVRLYFAGGQLIRWIIDQNAPQDNVPNDEWESYYEKATEALKNAQDAMGW